MEENSRRDHNLVQLLGTTIFRPMMEYMAYKECQELLAKLFRELRNLCSI